MPRLARPRHRGRRPLRVWDNAKTVWWWMVRPRAAPKARRGLTGGHDWDATVQRAFFGAGQTVGHGPGLALVRGRLFAWVGPSRRGDAPDGLIRLLAGSPLRRLWDKETPGKGEGAALVAGRPSWHHSGLGAVGLTRIALMPRSSALLARLRATPEVPKITTPPRGRGVSSIWSMALKPAALP